MSAHMGRRRQSRLDLPPHMHFRRGRYYYGRNQVALGPDFSVALRKYAELHTGHADSGTFEEAVRLYLRDELASKAPKTQREYERQLATLRGAFGRFNLDQIAPGDVSEFLKERSKPKTNAKGRAVGGAIAATREKALFSAVFNFARASRLTNAANPAVGIRGKKSRSATYVEDGDLARVIEHADQPLADFLELAYRTGADASVVLKFTRADVKDGALWVRRTKTGARIRIDVVGPLQALLERIEARPVKTIFLIADERGQPFTLGAMRKRFWKARALAGVEFTIRDLRPKAGSDADDLRAANLLLGHADESTTAIYRRKRIGERAKPIMRAIKK